LETVVKKWLNDKNCGFLENGGGQDIMVRKADLTNCQFLKVGARVEFECHADKRGLVAKKVKLLPLKKSQGQQNSRQQPKREYRPGVMT
jgi:cold shock CspA family protein